MPTYVWIVWPLLVLPVLASLIRQRDAWPFSRFPMFSHRMGPEDVDLVRIAIENTDGEIAWWRPRFFRLPDTLAKRFKSFRHDPSSTTMKDRRVLELAAEAQQLIAVDGSGLPNPAAVLFVRRRVELSAGAFVPRDEVVGRVAFPGPPAHDRRQNG